MNGDIEIRSENGITRLQLVGYGERNAMTSHMMSRMTQILSNLTSETRVVIISGGKNGWFCGGGHVGSLERLSISEVNALTSTPFIDLHHGIRNAKVPIIANVNGNVAANGVALVAACDVAVASYDSEFAMPEINVGLIPLLATVVLIRHVPPKTIFELAYFGRRFSAENAKAYGLLTRVAESGTTRDAQVEEWAKELAGRSRDALSVGRAAFVAMMNEGIDRDMRLAAASLTALFRTDEVLATLRGTGGHAFADKPTGQS
jgi:enoyl-CoA hydratase/carnithine racemase